MFRCTAVVAYLFRQNKRAQAIQTRWTPRQMDMKQTVNLRTLTELSILVENKKVSESSCPRMSDHLLHMICPAGIIISIRYDPEDVFKETEISPEGFRLVVIMTFGEDIPLKCLANSSFASSSTLSSSKCLTCVSSLTRWFSIVFGTCRGDMDTLAVDSGLDSLCRLLRAARFSSFFCCWSFL